MNTTTCPYCGSVLEYTPESTTPYFCYECNTVFTHKDILYEDIRHKMQMLLVNTTKDNPRKCNIVITDEEDASLGYFPEEYVLVNSAYLDEDDNILFNIEGMEDPYSFDNFDFEEVQSIYKSICENNNKRLIEEIDAYLKGIIYYAEHITSGNYTHNTHIIVNSAKLIQDKIKILNNSML